MKEKILVLAPYPNESNQNDGFIQRVKKMDDFMTGYKRVYIQVSLRSFFHKEKIRYGEEVTAFKINIILHWYLLLKFALSVDLIYSHTIYNLFWLANFFRFIKAPIILDVHGTVPEEILMSGNRSRSLKFDRLEKKCFSKITTAIFVTDSMRRHYEIKYPEFSFNCIDYGIIPEHINETNRQVDKQKLDVLKRQLNISEQDTVVIYSGGLHIWQNIDEMIDCVMKKENDQNIVYIFLVSDKDTMKKKLEKLNLVDKRIILDSVHPSELKLYYSISHYGFVLRDDNVVNRVANPTKLIEYLYYNVIPIVKLIEIGDFNKFGYEYITKEHFINSYLENEKCSKNGNVVDNIFSRYNAQTIKKIFDKL